MTTFCFGVYIVKLVHDPHCFPWWSTHVKVILMLGSAWGYNRGPGWCSVLQCLSCLPLHNCDQQTHLHSTHTWYSFFNWLLLYVRVMTYGFNLRRKKPNGLHVQKCEKILIWLKKCPPRTTPMINFFTGDSDARNKTVLPISACLHLKMKKKQKFNP